MLTHPLETYTRYIDAIRKDDVVAVRVMLEKDRFLANASLKDEAYQGKWVTPLQHAAICGSAKVFEVLLEFNADLNVVTEKGWKLKIVDRFHCDNYSIPFLLVFACQDECTANQNAQVASDAKAPQTKECGHLHIIRYLANHGIDLNSYEIGTNDSSYPTLNITYLAVAKGHANLLRVLNEIGVNLDHKPQDSKSVQDFADYFANDMPKSKHPACIALLKEARAKKVKAVHVKSGTASAGTAVADQKNQHALWSPRAHRQLKLRWRHPIQQMFNFSIYRIHLRTYTDALSVRAVGYDEQINVQRIVYPPVTSKLTAPNSVAQSKIATTRDPQSALPNGAAGDLPTNTDASVKTVTKAADASLPFQDPPVVDKKDEHDTKTEISKSIPLYNGNWVRVSGIHAFKLRVLTCNFDRKQWQFTYGWKFTTLAVVSNNILATGDDGGYVRLWNLAEERCISAGLHSYGGVIKLIVADDVVISQDRRYIKTWSLEGKLRQECDVGRDCQILDMTLQSQRRLAVLTTRNVHIYDIESAASLNSNVDRAPARLSPLQVVPHVDAKQVKKHLRWLLPQPESGVLTISDGKDGSIKVWQFDTAAQGYRCTATWENHGLDIVQAATLADGRLMALVCQNSLIGEKSYSLHGIDVVSKTAKIIPYNDLEYADENTVVMAHQNSVVLNYSNRYFTHLGIQDRKIQALSPARRRIESVIAHDNQLLLISPPYVYANDTRVFRNVENLDRTYYWEFPCTDRHSEDGQVSLQINSCFVKIGSFFVGSNFRRDTGPTDLGIIDLWCDKVYSQTLTCRIQPQPAQLYGLSNGLLLHIDPELGMLNFAELDRESEWIDQVFVPELIGAKNCRYSLRELPHGCLAIAAINGTNKNFVIVQIPPAIWNYDKTRWDVLGAVISQASAVLIPIVDEFLGKTKKQPVVVAENSAAASALTASVTTAVTAAPSHASVQRVSFWSVDDKGAVVVTAASTTATSSAGATAAAEPPRVSRNSALDCAIC